MKARVKVESFDSSMWGGMEPKDYQENVYLVAEGESISTVGLGQPYRFEVVRIRSKTVELVIRPELWRHVSEREQSVGALTLEVGEQASLQTQSFDAWGNWVLLLQDIV